MAVTVNINGANVGRKFAGIGGVTSNGMTKLLREYPQNQQDDILNLLFKPKFGASFHLLKIEIGSDANGTCGTEPSHMRSQTDFDITRGVGLWLGTKAKERNPEILLDAIRWGTPKWIDTETKKYLYYKNFLRGAHDVFGLNFDYLAPDENEGKFNRDYTVNTLRPGLNTDGFSHIKLAAADSTTDWNIAAMVHSDPALKNALAAINAHYKQDSPDNAKNSGLPIYDSEDLAPDRYNFASCLNVAYRIIKSYVSGKMVMYQMHPVIEAIYDDVPYTYKGVIAAAHPWSGYYEIDAGLWVTAHFTQFIFPGWYYIDSGCSSGSEHSYLTLKEQGTGAFSIIILNRGPTDVDYNFNLTNLAGEVLHAWGTNEEDHFYTMADIIIHGGSFSITVPAKTIYTLTTTWGQQKGRPSHAIPSNTLLALPYSDDFEKYDIGKQPNYTVDQAGAFEITDQGKNGGKCLKQIITPETRPHDWERRATPSPYTLLGDQNWKNYKVSADILLENIAETDNDCYALLGTRCNFSPTGNFPAECYGIRIYHDGRWELRKDAVILTTGILNNFSLNTWYSVKLIAVDNNISVEINGSQITGYIDDELPSGQIVIGSGYNRVRFDNLLVEQINSNTPVACNRYQEIDSRIEYLGSWEESGTNAKNYTRTLLVTKHTGDRMEFAFNGTAVSVIGSLDRNCGKADIYIDGSLKATVDTYSDSVKYRKSIYSAYQLSSGNHTFKLIVTGIKNSSSSDTYVNIDAVEICGGTGLIDFNHTPMPTNTLIPHTLYTTDFEDMTIGQHPTNWTVSTPADTNCIVDIFPGSANKCMKIVDSNKSEAASARKNFSVEDSYMTMEFKYCTEQTGKWFRMFAMDGQNSVIELYDSNVNGLCYRNASASDIKIMNIDPNVWYTIRLEIDILSKQFDVYVDGNLKHKHCAFRRQTTHIDSIDFGSGSGYTGTAYFDDVNAAINDLVSDNFNNMATAKQPIGWSITTHNETTCTVEDLPSIYDKSMRLLDANSAQNVTSTKLFARQHGRIVVRYKFLNETTGKWPHVSLSDDDATAIIIYDTGENGLCYRDTFDEYIKIMYLSPNTWYDVMIVADPSISRFDIYINGSLKKAGCSFRSMVSAINAITFSTGESYQVISYINDVSVKKGADQ
jgi:galactosylceramidase